MSIRGIEELRPSMGYQPRPLTPLPGHKQYYGDVDQRIAAEAQRSKELERRIERNLAETRTIIERREQALK